MTRHISILLGEIIQALIIPFEQASQPATFVDCTLGGGGHTAAMLERLGSTPLGRRHRVISIDQDAAAIEAARIRFKVEIEEGRLLLRHSRFSEFKLQPGEGPVLGVLADLGFSSDQIDSAERGLSFRLEGPLDMRLDPSRGRTAYQVLKTSTEREIADLIYGFGEERLSRRIAHRIVEARSQGQLPDSTTAFAELVARAFPPAERHGRIHPATRTFQALRIFVNDELGELDALLQGVIPSILSPGGRAAILSFHSLEDRRVKQSFASGSWKAVFKKPLEAGEAEVAENPRARSARLRVAERMEG